MLRSDPPPWDPSCGCSLSKAPRCPCLWLWLLWAVGPVHLSSWALLGAAGAAGLFPFGRVSLLRRFCPSVPPRGISRGVPQRSSSRASPWSPWGQTDTCPRSQGPLEEHSCLLQPRLLLGCSAPAASCLPPSWPGRRCPVAACRATGLCQRLGPGREAVVRHSEGSGGAGSCSPALPGSTWSSHWSSPPFTLWWHLVATCSAGATGAVVHWGLPCRWLEHSLAQHGSVAVSVLGPQLELLWKSSAEVARAVSQQCCSLLSWLQGSLPWLSDWVSGGSRAGGDKEHQWGFVGLGKLSQGEA